MEGSEKWLSTGFEDQTNLRVDRSIRLLSVRGRSGRMRGTLGRRVAPDEGVESSSLSYPVFAPLLLSHGTRKLPYRAPN